MLGTFWVSDKHLDKQQADAVRDQPESASFLVLGPAGSGKTNILLLRAKWYLLKALSELRVVVFTADLRDFIHLGCDQYGIPKETVITCTRFMRDILDEYDVVYSLTNDFSTDRTMLAGKVQSLLDEHSIENIFDALLVDECQDYTDTELLIFRKLTKRLILVADSRQSIYRVTHTPGLLEGLVDGSVITLKFHYRSGFRICSVADAIHKDTINFKPISGDSKYVEEGRPSSVSLNKCANLQDQFTLILTRLRSQLDLYPDELLGVLFPKRDQVAAFEQALDDFGLNAEKSRIRVETMHSAKGLEFRAVHVGGCEALYKMGATQKRLAYTSILRGKTSVNIYYSEKIPGYLEGAIAVLEPPKATPKFEDLFGS
jgi:superfamily I DNA/RNA helicase